jgi:hypothetical protein
MCQGDPGGRGTADSRLKRHVRELNPARGAVVAEQEVEADPIQTPAADKQVQVPVVVVVSAAGLEGQIAPEEDLGRGEPDHTVGPRPQVPKNEALVPGIPDEVVQTAITVEVLGDDGASPPVVIVPVILEAAFEPPIGDRQFLPLAHGRGC